MAGWISFFRANSGILACKLALESWPGTIDRLIGRAQHGCKIS